MTNAEARFNNSLRPRKPEGSLGRTAQDVHLDSHTAPELCADPGLLDDLYDPGLLDVYDTLLRNELLDRHVPLTTRRFSLRSSASPG